MASCGYKVSPRAVLLLWGVDDKILPIHQTDHFVGQLADLEVRQLSDVGHFPHFDLPETIAQAILDFVARAKDADAAANG